jgi:RecA/RadA recombinase
MAINKYMQKLLKLEGAVTERWDPFAPENLLRFSSPGVNWTFGRTHGMPRGFSALLWGERKSGKSLLGYDAIGQLHKSDPTAIAIKCDSEYRDLGQLPPEMAAAYGIDMDRLVVLQTNRAEDIFDPFSKNGMITEMLQDGANIGLLLIDSTSDILGRREAEQDSVINHQIGDHAITLQIGLKSILNTIRKYKVGVIMTAHARDEMNRIEIMRGNTKKPAVANAVLHFCEFQLFVEKNKSKDGKKDALDREFTDESRRDMATDDGEQTGHKVKVFMEDSTMGAKNRQAEFTLDYKRGIVNQHEEVFRLGLNWGIIGRPSKGQYVIGEHKFSGKPGILAALADSIELQKIVLQAVQALEGNTTFIGGASIDSTKGDEADE